MTRFDQLSSKETDAERTLRLISDEAEALAKTYTYPHNIFNALRGIEGAERMKMFRRVQDELKRRGKIQREQELEDAALMEELRLWEAEETRKDAYRHQMSQPASTWDPDHPENRL